MNILHENEVEIVIDIEQELKDELEEFKSKFGFTDQDVLYLGIAEMFQKTPLDQLLDTCDTTEDKIRFMQRRHEIYTYVIELLGIIIKKLEDEEVGLIE